MCSLQYISTLQPSYGHLPQLQRECKGWYRKDNILYVYATLFVVKHVLPTFANRYSRKISNMEQLLPQEKPYYADFLKAHRKINEGQTGRKFHTGENLQECSLCNKRFSDSRSLQAAATLNEFCVQRNKRSPCHCMHYSQIFMINYRNLRIFDDTFYMFI